MSERNLNTNQQSATLLVKSLLRLSTSCLSWRLAVGLYSVDLFYQLREHTVIFIVSRIMLNLDLDCDKTDYVSLT